MNFDKIIDKHNQEYASGGLMYVHEVEDAMREACEMVLDEAAERAECTIQDVIISESEHSVVTRKEWIVDKQSILGIKEELQ